MPRIPRVIAVGHPHHITQRGNYRQSVFDDDGDYGRYVEIFGAFAIKYGLDIWAWCLMPTHVHYVAVPNQPESLARTFNTAHMLYSQYVNRKRNVSGHLWQGRFYSCVLDQRHLYAAVRYVERNPVSGGLVRVPQDYRWSSARSHTDGRADPLLSGSCNMTEAVEDWGEFLEQDLDGEVTADVVRATRVGRPCGGIDFVRQMETLLDRPLSSRPRGRPRKIR